MLECMEGPGAVAIHLAMRAVVETEDVAGASSGGFGAISEASLPMVGDGLHARNQPFHRFLLPISRNQRPHDRAVAEIACRRNDPGIAHSKWRCGRGAAQPGLVWAPATKDSGAFRCDSRRCVHEQ